MKKINILKEKLKELYINKGLSTYKIAKIYNCNPKTIYYKLKLFKIKTRSIKKIQISKKELYYLYHVKKWPFSKIAKKFSCDKVTVFDRIRKYKIPSRTMSEAKTIYPKKDFSGDLIEKAYLIGFRLGDLNVFKKYSLICVQSSTTKVEQARLIEGLFKKYGHIIIKKYGKIFKLQTGLNKSFSFLITKKDSIPKWILRNNKYFAAFLAGYIDAEGNIGIYNNRARVRIRSYDKNILYLIHNKLKKCNIYSICKLETPSGKYNLNKDFYCLSLNKKDKILKLIKLIELCLKHEKRKTDLNKVKNHIKK